MILSILTNKKTNRAFTQLHCFIVFLLLTTPSILLLVAVFGFSGWKFHCLLFVIGWFFWTFMEYIVHRFWMHGKGYKLYRLSSKRHLYHHKHPHDLKIHAWHRSVMFVLIILFFYLSYYFDNYFTLFAGFYFGFAAFCFMHLLLHKKRGRTVFKELVQFHIYHHCKYPDRCHGVTVTWWDKLFNTAPPQEAFISDRIIDFYFHQHH